MVNVCLLARTILDSTYWTLSNLLILLSLRSLVCYFALNLTLLLGSRLKLTFNEMCTVSVVFSPQVSRPGAVCCNGRRIWCTAGSMLKYNKLVPIRSKIWKFEWEFLRSLVSVVNKEMNGAAILCNPLHVCQFLLFPSMLLPFGNFQGNSDD